MTSYPQGDLDTIATVLAADNAARGYPRTARGKGRGICVSATTTSQYDAMQSPDDATLYAYQVDDPEALDLVLDEKDQKDAIKAARKAIKDAGEEKPDGWGRVKIKAKDLDAEEEAEE